MNLAKIFEKIEGVRFAIDFSVISGFTIFRRALEENKTLLSLIDDVKQRPAHKDRVLERLISVLQADHSPEFQHPNDIAVAAYLFVLYKVNPSLAHYLAEQLLDYPNLWWSRWLAKRIAEQLSAGYIQFQIGGALPTAVYRAEVSNVEANVKSVNWLPTPVKAAYGAPSGSYSKNTKIDLGIDMISLPDETEAFVMEKAS